MTDDELAGVERLRAVAVKAGRQRAIAIFPACVRGDRDGRNGAVGVVRSCRT